MELQILGDIGYTAQKKRNILAGTQFDHLFPKAEMSTNSVSKNADVHLTINTIVAASHKYKNQTAKLAVYLQEKSSGVEDLCRNIFDFYYKHVDYKEDAYRIEQLKTPARLWADRAGDCDCYTLSISTILHNLAIEHYSCVVKIGGKSDFQHIYIIVPKDPKNFVPERDKNNPSKYYAIDPVVDSPLTEPDHVSFKYLKNMNETNSLNGVNQTVLTFGKEMNGLGKRAAYLGSTCRNDVASQELMKDILNRVQAHIIATVERLEEKNFDGKQYMIENLKMLAQNIHDPIEREQVIRRIIESQNEGLGNIFQRGFDWAKGVLVKFVEGVKSVIDKAKDTARKGVQWVSNIVQEVWDFVVKINPVSMLIRSVILKAFRRNSGRMSEKLRWAFADNQQLRIARMPENTRSEARKRFDKINAVFVKAGGNTEELIETILTASPLPEIVLDDKTWQLAVKGTNFILDTKNYTVAELKQNKNLGYWINSYNSIMQIGPASKVSLSQNEVLEALDIYQNRYLKIAPKQRKASDALIVVNSKTINALTIEKALRGEFADKTTGYFLSITRNDNWNLVFYIDEFRNTAYFYKAYSTSAAIESNKFVEINYIGIGVKHYKATNSDASALSRIISNQELAFKNSVVETNFQIALNKDYAIAAFNSDSKMKNYYDTAISTNVQDKQFFVLPKNDNTFYVYRLNSNPASISQYDANYADARIANTSLPIYADSANLELFNNNTPRIEFHKFLSLNEYQTLRGNNTITIKNGAFLFAAGHTDIYRHLQSRYQIKTASQTDKSSGASTSSSSNFTTILPGGSFSTSFNTPMGITLGRYDMYSLGCACTQKSLNGTLGVVDPVTLSVIANIGKQFIGNMAKYCAEQQGLQFDPNDPGLNDPNAVNKNALALLKLADGYLQKNPDIAGELNKDLPDTSRNITLNPVNPEDIDIDLPEQVSDDDVQKQVSDITTKNNISAEALMQFLPLIGDNTFSYNDELNQQDMTNAGYEGQSLLAKFFTWMRDMWHSIFPAHTWLGKFASFVYGGLAKLTDIVWKSVKKMFGCGNPPTGLPEPTPTESNNTPLIVAGVAAAGIGLIAINSKSKGLPDKSLSGPNVKSKRVEFIKSEKTRKKIKYEI